MSAQQADRAKARGDAGGPPGGRHPAVRRTTLSALFGFLLPSSLFIALASPSPALAVDGRIDVRGTAQKGLAGGGSYRTETLREEGVAGQRFVFLPRLTLQTRFHFLREETESNVLGTLSESVNRTWQPAFDLGYSADRLRLALSGSGYWKETALPSGGGPSLGRLEYGARLNARDEGTARLGLRLSARDSWREEGSSPRDEVRERVGALDVERVLGPVGRLQYSFSGLIDDAVDREVRTTQATHRIRFDGQRSFAGGRADLAVRTRSHFFRQIVEVGGGTDRIVLLVPLEGGLLLDDTPAELDPLEEGLEAVPALYDRDRSAPSTIDLGDDAPVVREFGGDYRNIQYDFGEDVSLASAVLYIDRTLLNPELFLWELYASDDPEGRIWREIGGEEYTIDYVERSEGLQGWEVAFSESLTARFFKMVDRKIGTTVPELYVTELEVYGPDRGDAVQTTDRTRTHRIDGSLGYAVTRSLRIRYEAMYRQRGFSDENRNLVERSHGAVSSWTAGPFLVAGRYQIHTLSSPTRQNTDVTSSSLSIKETGPRSLVGSLSWARTTDKSGDLDKTTDAYTLGFLWRLAPGLRLDQRTTYGRLTDRALDARSSSITLSGSVRSRPVAAMSADLQRTDRWVDQEAGTGFIRFNDTALTLSWTPVRRVTARSSIRYQVRDEADWIVQHLLSWRPIPGGSVEARVSLNRFQDTRNDSSQKGAGFSLLWRVNARLLLEGNVDSQRYEVAGDANTPMNGGFRAALTF